MDITYRIPSRKVPYGYLEFTVSEGESLPDPVTLAEDYAQYIKDYQTAEVQAFEHPSTGQLQRADSWSKKAEDKAVDEAAKMLSDGLGATEIDESEPAKPWDKSSDETESTTESKPWDTNAGDWDFS
jgi:hypothetical protein